MNSLLCVKVHTATQVRKKWFNTILINITVKRICVTYNLNVPYVAQFSIFITWLLNVATPRMHVNLCEVETVLMLKPMILSYWIVTGLLLEE